MDANLAVYGAVRYRYNDLGEVELRGMAKALSHARAVGANLFTLPTPVRPDTKRVWSIGDNSRLLRSLTIDTLGRVQLSAIAASAEFSLDGIRFSAD
ncbi:hypothetical protein [Hyalangium versicolor]|uniref:hypothetical protein n=1 Tax=Hyalangium versicolor TaxID=2861190 RepID=UPI001CC90B0C|nr:hypothetical protein [Hyalangium versicolor]